MTGSIRYVGKSTWLLAALSIAISGCRSTTVIEEAAINGLDISQSGQIIVTVRSTHVQGSLLVETETTSPLLTVVFMNQDGQEVDVSARSMDAVVANEAMATYASTSPGAFTGNITGLGDGTTSINFRLRDGTTGTGTLLYTSPAIPLEVLGGPS